MNNNSVFLMIIFFIFAFLIFNCCFSFTDSLGNFSKLSLRLEYVESKKYKEKVENLSIYNYLVGILIALLLIIAIIIFAIKDKIFETKEDENVDN